MNKPHSMLSRDSIDLANLPTLNLVIVRADGVYPARLKKLVKFFKGIGDNGIDLLISYGYGHYPPNDINKDAIRLASVSRHTGRRYWVLLGAPSRVPTQQALAFVDNFIQRIANRVLCVSFEKDGMKFEDEGNSWVDTQDLPLGLEAL